MSYYNPPESEGDPIAVEHPNYTKASYSYYPIIVHGAFLILYAYSMIQPRTQMLYLNIAVIFSELVYWCCPLHHVYTFCRYIEGTSLFTLIVTSFNLNTQYLFLGMLQVFFTLICRLTLWLSNIRETQELLQARAQQLRLDRSHIVINQHRFYQESLSKIRLKFLVVNSILAFLIVFLFLSSEPWSQEDTLHTNFQELRTDVQRIKDDTADLKLMMHKLLNRQRY